MFKKLLLLLTIFAMLNKLAIAQIEVTVTKTQVLSNVTNAKTYYSYIMFNDDGNVPKFEPAAVIYVNTKYKFVRVRARQSLFEGSNVLKLSESEYVLLGSGKYSVEITAFDPELGIDEYSTVVELGEVKPPEPTPNPTPNPSPVPDDQFNNVGQKVQEWSKGLEKRAELGAIYKEASKMLTDSPITSINDATAYVADMKNKLLGQSASKYSVFFENVNADLKSRWPMSRMDYALYLACVANGLVTPSK